MDTVKAAPSATKLALQPLQTVKGGPALSSFSLFRSSSCAFSPLASYFLQYSSLRDAHVRPVCVCVVARVTVCVTRRL